jgi:malonyl CoA-acyl carrier protein transacylase/phosphopantetheinyl transferase
MHAVLRRLGITPRGIAGHSTGEYSALLAAGAVEVDGEHRMIEHILDGNRATERATRDGLVPHGVLLTVGPADPEALRAIVDGDGGGLHLAMDNCPHQAVLCGTEEKVARAEAELRARGTVCQRLPFARAYHTPLFAPVCDELRDFYERAKFVPPRIPLYSCTIAGPVPADADEVRRLALEHWRRPVRFRETIRAMHDAGMRIFVEVGPRGNLTAFVQDILRGVPHLAVASNVQRRSGVTQLNHMLALLAAHGVPLSLRSLYDRRGVRRLPLAALRDGSRLPAKGGRSMRISLDLPVLRVDESAHRARPADRPAQGPAAVDTPRREVVRRKAPASPVPADASASVPDDASASVPDDAIVMGEYLSTMRQFLRTQEEVMRSALAPDEPPAGPPRGPLLGRIVRRDPGGAVTFRRTLALDEEIFLRDHTLGGRISEDASLRPLAIFPLAMSLEIMAEAAVAMVPGQRAVALRAVKVHRWLAFPEPRRELEILAVPRPSGTEVDVRIHEIRDVADGGSSMACVEGTVALGPDYPAAPDREPPRLSNARPCRWGPDELYAEGKVHGMFHGPSLQGVVSVDRIGAEGAEATLRVLPRERLFRSLPRPEFEIDPLTLDAASQVLGYWTADVLERAFVVFPVTIDRLDLHAPPLRPEAGARCRMRCAATGGDRIRADFDVVGSDGAILARVAGWEVKRIDLPDRIYAFRLAPRNVLLSSPMTAPASEGEVVHCCRLELPERFLEADGEIWREALAHLALSRKEREVWRGLANARRRAEWLLGRLAAKDAVRLLLKSRLDLDVHPADVDVTADAWGRPVAGGGWVERLGRAPALSLSHSNGVAVAVARDARDEAGVGVDIEPLRRMDPGFEIAALNPDERGLLDALAHGRREEWILRLWCAKEAAAKALGRGLMGNPRNLVARDIDPLRGTVRLRVEGSTAEDLPDVAGFSLTAWTGRDGNMIVATAL